MKTERTGASQSGAHAPAPAVQTGISHSFSVDVATQHGVHAAVLFETIRFWVLKNRANGKHLHDGRHWTYNSARAFSELFPYLSSDQIQRALKRLEESELITVGCFNSSPYDRTRWYSTADGCVTHSAELRNHIPHERDTNTSSEQVQTTVQDAPRKRGASPAGRLTAQDLKAEGVDESYAEAWLAIRKEKRLPLTSGAWALAKESAQSVGLTPAEMVRECLSRGWASFRADWWTDRPSRPAPLQPSQSGDWTRGAV